MIDFFFEKIYSYFWYFLINLENDFLHEEEYLYCHFERL